MKSQFYFCKYSDQFYYDFLVHLLLLSSFLQFVMKSFVSKISFLFMTLVFPLSTMKCFVVLIFIFSGKKSSFRYTFLLQCLRSAFSLLPVSFCSPLGRCPLPPSGCPLIETSASFPLNSLLLFLIFLLSLQLFSK